jgi:hypothetical protein
LTKIHHFDSETLLQIQKLTYDMELALRMYKSGVTDKLATATTALEQIRRESAVVGYDSGHSGIHRLASAALDEIDGK